MTNQPQIQNLELPLLAEILIAGEPADQHLNQPGDELLPLDLEAWG